MRSFLELWTAVRGGADEQQREKLLAQIPLASALIEWPAGQERFRERPGIRQSLCRGYLLQTEHSAVACTADSRMTDALNLKGSGIKDLHFQKESRMYPPLCTPGTYHL
ncbi:hypothetical protein [Archangium sp.]|uniref:hypothetical protein n=1 Tax=Archangium sp. TaxID=1872627 RepID=UPI002D61E4FE|nr:hypothetical protein [Archangium sp.]HYO60021.1 hypothetical protein [Archangium sp.]